MMQNPSLIKKGRIRNNDNEIIHKTTPIPNTIVSKGIAQIPEVQSTNSNTYQFTEHRWTDIPLEHSLTKYADEEIWSHGNGTTQILRNNQIQIIGDVYPHRDAALLFQVKGLRGNLDYDIGGKVHYLVKNGGIEWEMPGLNAWFGAFTKNQDTTSTNLKKRSSNWQLGTNWNFPEKNSLWNVDLSQEGSRVQWNVHEEWITQVLAKSIHWSIPDCGHWWIDRTQLNSGIQSQGSLLLDAKTKLSIESNVLEMNPKQIWTLQTETVNWQIDKSLTSILKGQSLWKQSNLIFDIGGGSTQLAPIGYKIDSHYGDWQWNLSQGNFYMNLIHQPGKKKGWEWKTEQDDSFWNILLGANTLQWNQGVFTLEQSGDFQLNSLEGDVKIQSNNLYYTSNIEDSNISWNTGSITTDVKNLYQTKLLSSQTRFEIIQDNNIDFRIGDTRIGNHNLYWSSIGGIHWETKEDFQVSASHSRWNLTGEKGLHIQCVKPFGNIRLEAGEGGYIELKGQKLHINCNDWVWRGQDSFYGVQEKGWTWATPKGKLTGFSGDSQLSPLSWSGAEGGIEWQTYNLEQCIFLQTSGAESMIHLNSERSGCEIHTGGPEGIYFHMNLHNDNVNGVDPKGWRVEMDSAGPLDWKILDKSYWRVKLDGPYEFSSQGIGAQFQRTIQLDGLDAEHLDWEEITGQLHFGAKSREIHQINRSYNDGSIIEWDWSQPQSQWIANIGSLFQFNLAQENARFEILAERPRSTIHLQSTGNLQLHSQDSHISLKAHQGDIYLQPARLLEQKIEEGVWRLRVGKPPAQAQRSVDIQVNGQMYSASTRSQIYRILNDCDGGFHWIIGKNLPNESEKSGCGFQWTIDDQRFILDKTGLHLNALKVSDSVNEIYEIGNNGVHFKGKNEWLFNGNEYSIRLNDCEWNEIIRGVKRDRHWIEVNESLTWSGEGRYEVQANEVDVRELYRTFEMSLGNKYVLETGDESKSLFYQDGREQRNVSLSWLWSASDSSDSIIHFMKDLLELRVKDNEFQLSDDGMKVRVGGMELSLGDSQDLSFLRVRAGCDFKVQLNEGSEFGISLGGGRYVVGEDDTMKWVMTKDRLRWENEECEMEWGEKWGVKHRELDWRIGKKWNLNLDDGNLHWFSGDNTFDWEIGENNYRLRMGESIIEVKTEQIRLENVESLLEVGEKGFIFKGRELSGSLGRVDLQSDFFNCEATGNLWLECEEDMTQTAGRDLLQSARGKISMRSDSDNRDAMNWKCESLNGGFSWMTGNEGSMLWESGNEMSWILKSGKKTWTFGESGGHWIWDGRDKFVKESKYLSYSLLMMGENNTNTESEKFEKIRSLMKSVWDGWNHGEVYVKGLLKQGKEQDLSIKLEEYGSNTISWQTHHGLKYEKNNEVKRYYEGTCQDFFNYDVSYELAWGGSLGSPLRKIRFVNGDMVWDNHDQWEPMTMNFTNNVFIIDKPIQSPKIKTGGLCITNNVIESRSELVIRAENISFDGLVLLGENVIDGGCGIKSYSNLRDWEIYYETVKMKNIKANTVEVDSIDVNSVAINENVSVRGDVVVDGETRLEDVKVRGRLVRESDSVGDHYFDEVKEDDIGNMLDDMDIVKTANMKMEGLVGGEKVTETIDLWDMVMILTAEVKRLRSLLKEKE